MLIHRIAEEILFRLCLKRWTLRRKILVFVFVGFIVFFLADLKLRPLITSVAANRAQVISTTIINDVVHDEISRQDVNYSDIALLEKDPNGHICAINTNIKKINLLKTSVCMAVQKKISEIKNDDYKVALGTLTGTELFNGRGPKIPLKLSLSGSVKANFRSNFETAGINQTKHQLYLDVSTKVFALIPGYPTNSTIETSILVAETVLIGDVPKFLAK